MSSRRYQVKEVALLSGVSVRTLHHYDRLGLLTPSGRTEAGYRLYSDNDLLRLQQILVQRELGLALEDIRSLLDDPGFDRKAALRHQRAQLVLRAEHTDAMIRAIDAALQEEREQDMTQIFNGFDPAKYEHETQQRWGNDERYKESQRRTKHRTPEQWREQQAENAAIMRSLAAAMSGGEAADDPSVMELAEQHRLSIDRWFYPCSKAAHVQLADLYEADARYAQSIDQHAPGLTPFLAAAIRANAERA
jgi:DNA-binding transcriptional MerR regulator